jgi:phosphohistidine phosphatase
MMGKRRLILLRHAKSSWDDPSLPDHDRPLAKRGIKAAAAIRRYMRAEKLVPDLVLVSSARRTQQTLDAVKFWDPPLAVEVKQALYLASPATMLELLAGVPDDTGCVLLIGHNPGMQELAVQLTKASKNPDRQHLARRMSESFPTGALAEFSLSGNWSEIGPGAGKLLRFVCPRDVPKVSADGEPEC